MLKFVGNLNVEYKGMKPFVDEYSDPMAMLSQLLGYAVRENGEKAVRELVESIAGCHPDAVEVGLTRDAFIAHLISNADGVIQPWWLCSTDESKTIRLNNVENAYDQFVHAEFQAQAARDEMADAQDAVDFRNAKLAEQQDTNDATARELENTIQAQRYDQEPEPAGDPVPVNITGSVNIQAEDTVAEVNKPAGRPFSWQNGGDDDGNSKDS